jgi:hypothetical protein
MHMKLTAMVYGMISGVVVCAAFASTAHAECEGPFTSTTALTACWSATSHPQTFEIYVDGHKVWEQPGPSGIYLTRQYFDCADGSGIKPACQSSPVTAEEYPFATQDAYASTNLADFVFGRSFDLFLDNGTVPIANHNSSPYSLRLKTCHGDQSHSGPVKYFVVSSLFDGFAPPWPSNDCF